MSAGAPTPGGLKRLSNLLAGQSKSAVSITGGTISGVTISGTLNPTTLTLTTATLAAAGTDQATAAAITSQGVNVTGANGTVAVRLPAATAGALYLVYNSVATNGLPVFPTGSETINGGTGAAAVTLEGKTLGIFFCAAAGNWAAIFTANT